MRFVDERPIVLDQSRLPSPPRWQVRVFNGDSSSPAQVSLSVASPTLAGLVIDGPSTMTVPPSGTVAFPLQLTGGGVGTARLLAISSDGTLATREVVVEATDGVVPLPEEISLSATDVTPWSSHVHLPSVRLFGVTDDDGPTVVGVVTSGSGRSARVVLEDGRLSVDGIRAAGEYRGTALLQQRPVKVKVQVHDAPGFPLLVLLGGLLLVGVLDRYNKRTKPRQVLEIHLAQLQKRARLAQAAATAALHDIPEGIRPPGVHRISDEAGTTKLLLDREAEAALLSWDGAVDAAELERWAEGGPGLAEVAGHIAALEQLHGKVRRLLEGVAGQLPLLPDGALPQESRLAASLAAANEDLDALTADDLTHGDELVGAAQASLERFSDLYRRLKHIAASTADLALEQRANRLLTRLCGGSGYPEVEHETGEIEAAALLAAAAQADRDFARLPAPAPAVPPAPGAGPGSRAPAPGGGEDPRADPSGGAGRARAGRRWATLASVAACLLVVLAAAGLFASRGGDPVASTRPAPTRPPPDGGTSSAGPPAGGPRGTGTTPPASTPAPPSPSTTLPDAPVAQPARGQPADQLESESASLVEVGLRGVVLPLAVAAALGGLAWLVVRQIRRGRLAATGLTANPDTLTGALRKDQRRFDVLSGLIVVLTGLSVLYFSDPTFGSLGDYVKVLLWGSGVGEGVQLARRIIPALPT